MVDAGEAAYSVSVGLRMAEADPVLLQGGRRPMCRRNHRRQLHLHERIPWMYRTPRHHASYRQATIYIVICDNCH